MEFDALDLPEEAQLAAQTGKSRTTAADKEALPDRTVDARFDAYLLQGSAGELTQPQFLHGPAVVEAFIDHLAQLVTPSGIEQLQPQFPVEEAAHPPCGFIHLQTVKMVFKQAGSGQAGLRNRTRLLAHLDAQGPPAEGRNLVDPDCPVIALGAAGGELRGRFTPLFIHQTEGLIFRQELIVDVNGVEPGALPVEGVEDHQSWHPIRREDALEEAEGRLAQEAALHGAVPDISGLFSPLFLAVGGEGIGDALGGAHGVFVPEIKLIHHPCDAAGHGSRQFDARQPGDGEQPLIGDHPGLGLPPGCGFALGGAEAVGPPVRPGGAQHRQGIACAGGDVVEKLAGGGAAQARPQILVVPGLDDRRGHGRWRSIVSEVAAELEREGIVGIAPFLEAVQIDGEGVDKIPFVSGEQAEHIAGHVMVGAEGEHSLPRRRLPPEGGGNRKGFEGAGVVDARGDITDAERVQVIGQAPGEAVDVVLHGCADRQSQRLKFAQGLEGMEQGVLVG